MVGIVVIELRLYLVQKGADVVSPPFHPECDTTENTVKFIERVQQVSGLPTGFKLCVGTVSEFENLVVEMKRQDIFPDVTGGRHD